MASDNSVVLVGNLTDDPELRYTPAGAAVANFTVAVNSRYKDQSGQWQDKLEGFFRCSCWREQAEHVTESCQKGMRVVVVGRLQQRSWEAQDGSKRSTVEVQVDEVAPSLRWATAQVQRSSRSSSGGGGAPQGGQPFGGQQGAPQGDAPQGGGQSQAPAPTPAPSPGAVDDWGSPVGGQTDEGGF